MHSLKSFARFQWRGGLVFIAAGLLLVSASVGWAQTSRFWNRAAGGNWNNITSWNPFGAVPGANDPVYITNTFSGADYTVNLDLNYGPVMPLGSLTLGSASSGFARQTLVVTTNIMFINGVFFVNHGGVLNLGNTNFVNFVTNSTPPQIIVQSLISQSAGEIMPYSGTINFVNGVILTPTSKLRFPISPPNGQLSVVRGGIILDGTLTAGLGIGFSPNVGDTFRILSWPNASSRHGGFAQNNSTFDLGSGLYFQGIADYAGLTLVTKTTNNPSPPPPTNLVNQVVAVGDSASFFITPLGQDPFTYQWQFNGTNLNSQTNYNLILPNAQLTNAGNYCVTVADALNVTNTYCASLSVLLPPAFTNQPDSQTVAAGSNVTFAAGATGSGPFNYQWRLNGQNIADATSSTYAISNAQPADGGTYSVALANPVRVVTSTNAVLKVTATAASFQDIFANAGSITGTNLIRSGSNTNATLESGEPLHADKTGGHSVWLNWTAPFTGIATLDTSGSSFDTLLGVYTGASVSNLTAIASDDDSGGFFTSRIIFNAIGGTNYHLAVDGRAGATGNIVLSLNLTNLTQTPQILLQPSSLTVATGDTATFNVSATNTTSLTYQWFYNDWIALPGATSATLTISNVDYRNVGPYSVEIRSTNGQTIASEEALLEIGPLATAHSFDKLQDLLDSVAGISSPGRIKPPGSSASTFPSVAAGTIGSQTINSYDSTTGQEDATNNSTVISGSSTWYELDVTSNATMVVDTSGSDYDTTLGIYTGTNIFSLTLVTNNDNAISGVTWSRVQFNAMKGTNYLIDVDGVGGAKGNAKLNWKLGTPPTATNLNLNYNPSQGTNLSLKAGDTNGVPVPNYQWRLNGTNIIGATNATLTLTNLQFGQSGNYTLVVSNFMSTVTNSIAKVSVAVALQVQLNRSSGVTNFFQLTGSATQAVVLQRSTNLTVWSPLFTNSNSNLLINYTDTNPGTRPQGFYRFKRWP